MCIRRLRPQPHCNQRVSRYPSSGIAVNVESIQTLKNSSLVGKYGSGCFESQCLVSRPHKYLPPLGALVTSQTQAIPSTPVVADEKIGVLLLNLGGPETLDDVQPFLFNLFADPVLSSLAISLFRGHAYAWMFSYLVCCIYGCLLGLLTSCCWPGYHSIAKVVPVSSKASGTIHFCC